MVSAGSRGKVGTTEDTISVSPVGFVRGVVKAQHATLIPICHPQPTVPISIHVVGMEGVLCGSEEDSYIKVRLTEDAIGVGPTGLRGGTIKA